MRLIKNYCYVIAILGLFPASANALILNYTGANFTSVQNHAPSLETFTSTDNVSFSLNLTEALGNNLNLAAISPVAFTASAGALTLSNLTTTNSFFHFSTDSVGQITEWALNASIFSPTTGGGYTKGISTTNLSDPIWGSVADMASSMLCGPLSTAIGCNPGAENKGSIWDNMGTWSYQTSTASSVPEPGTLGLFALGLLGLAYRKRQIA